MALEVFDYNCVYCTKSNIAVPTVGATAATFATNAQNRIKDAFTDSNASQTQRISAITVANPPVVNQ